MMAPQKEEGALLVGGIDGGITDDLIQELAQIAVLKASFDSAPSLHIQPILGHAKTFLTGHYASIDKPTRFRALNRLCESTLIRDNVARFTSPLISPLSAETM